MYKAFIRVGRVEEENVGIDFHGLVTIGKLAKRGLESDEMSAIIVGRTYSMEITLHLDFGA